jgi:hypothetical protein
MWRALTSGDLIRALLIPQVRQFDETFSSKVYPPFADPEGDAARVAREYVTERMNQLGEDADFGSIADDAHDREVAFYQTQVSIQFTVVNLFTAGIYHVFEQQIASLYRDWTATTPKTVGQVRDWLSGTLGIDIETAPTWSTIDELRIVANVVKHAEGNAAERLQQVNPDLFQLPLMRQPGYRDLIPPSDFRRPVEAPLTGEDLYVTKDDYDRYVRSVLDFWEWLLNQIEAIRSDVEAAIDSRGEEG